MSKLMRFMIMDLISIKSELKSKRIFLSLLIAIAGYVSLGASGITMGLLPLVTLLATYPFAAGDNGLDHLYATLGITRKSVVAGRYLFALAMGVLVTIVFFALGITVATILGDAVSLTDFATILTVAFMITSLIVALNLPLLFKLGFRDAKSFATMFPLILILGIMLLINTFGNGSPYFLAQLSYDLSGFASGSIVNPIVVLVAVTWILLMICSYTLSLKFYGKRDF